MKVRLFALFFGLLMTGCETVKDFVYKEFVEPALTILLVVFILVVVWFFLVLVFGPRVRAGIDKQVDEDKRKFDKGVRSFFEQYKKPLTRKRFQLITTDDYGDLDRKKWDKELLSFIEKKIVPTLSKPSSILPSNSLQNMWSPSNEEVLARIFNLLESLTLEHLEEFQSRYVFHENMDGIMYEHFCANILRDCGWAVQVLQASGDQGVDLIAAKNNLEVAIQCKRFSSNVGNGAIQEVVAGKAHYQTDAAAVVSNSSFTASAKQLAASNNVLLLHHDDLEDLGFE